MRWKDSKVWRWQGGEVANVVRWQHGKVVRG